MAGLLTVGRRPREGYKGSMKLHEAYESLGLISPVEHERVASRTMVFPDGTESDPRRTGASVRTLVEMYLDHERALRSVGYSSSHKVKFLFVCLTPKHGERLRRSLQEIHEKLDLDVDLAQVTFFPHDGADHVVKGTLYHSWGIFCDHAVKEKQGIDRALGPYGLVRTIKGEGNGRFVALDRDDRLVCKLTERGSYDLISHSTCPVHFQPSPRVAGTTFSAWTRKDLEPVFRLSRAWDL
jgi:hypothetical protein